MPNASELLNSLQETFGLKKKKPPEAPAAIEMPAAMPAAPALESAPAIAPEPTATETPSPVPEPAVVAPAGELPDWLSAPSAVEPIPTPTATPDWLQGGQMAVEEMAPAAPLPEPEAPVAGMPAVVAEAPATVEAPTPVPEAPTALPVGEAPALETPVAPPAVEAEKSPEQMAVEQFEEALLAADEALAVLRVGVQNLDADELRAAMGAAATANGLIRNLPEHYLRVLLASRRLGENREYTRMNFQEDMGAAIRIFSQAKKG